MRHILLATLCIAALCPLQAQAETQSPSDASALAQLRGTYVSPAVEPWYGGFGTREFVFADGGWQLIFTHALDPQMVLRTFQFRTGGDYRVGAAHPTLPATFEVDFDEDWKHLTLLTRDPQVIGGMGLADCTLTPNLETDISAQGCGPWPSVAECGTDHDLLALDETGLRFGQRPADNNMCSPDRRPDSLLSPVVERIAP